MEEKEISSIELDTLKKLLANFREKYGGVIS